MKLYYSEPSLEILSFAAEDVITVSNLGEGIGYGDIFDWEILE